MSLRGIQYLKNVREVCALNFQILAVSRACIRLFLFRYRTEALTERSMKF